MINATFFVDSQEHILCCSVTGHSELSTKGTDILCAAVSAQVAMLEIGILTYAKKEPVIVKKAGFFTLETPECEEKTQVLFQSFLFALLSIEKKYSQFIKIKVSH